MGMRIRRRSLITLVVIWFVLSAVSSWCTIQAWTHGATGPVVFVSNLAWIINLPGWVVVHLIPGMARRTEPSAIIAANAIGWGLWILTGMILIRVRSWLHLNWVTPREPESLAVPSRRAFLTNSTLGSIAICAAAAPGYATLIEPWSIKVRKYRIPIKDLPESFEGLRIVQVSDTHLGPRIPESFIESVYQKAMDLKPDLMFLTGDHVHDGIREHQRAAELCKPLVDSTPMGVVGVLGNHDWWGDGHALTRLLNDAGVHMIDNDRLWIDPQTRSLVTNDPGNPSLAIVGLGDLTDSKIRTRHAFRDVADSTPRLVLAHNPDTAEIGPLISSQGPRVDLMLSGHTHGGQGRIPLLGTPIGPSRYGQRYAGGLVDGPAFRVCVSRGVGMSMLPVRVGVPPEISEITLVRSQTSS